jgi:carotenoid cleavage dioxygenase-like enzyme
MNVLIICLIIAFTNAFQPPFNIPRRENRRTIILPPKSPFRELNGFYGLIGPDVQMNNIQTLYDLFTGDGKIQGVFFQPNNNPTFVTHLVRTDKLLYESIHGRFSKHIWMTPLYVLLNKVGILPNVLGLANTALLPVGRRLFALFERDFPYELKLDVENKRIQTVKKVYLPGLSHFSGHSKYVKGVVHTIDYDVVWNRLNYVQLDSSFREHSRHSIHTRYIPLIHDFAILSDGKVLIVDAPFVWNIIPFGLQEGRILNFLNEGIFPKDIPVVFDKTRPTYINLYDPQQKRLNQIVCQMPPFYWFHVAYTEYQGDDLNIYAPMYDNVNFSSLNLDGKYRQITVRASGQVVIKKNPLLERLNLDFPIRVGNYVVLREIENRAIRGFVVCRELRLIRRIRLPVDRAFCGEPSVVEIGGQPYLLGFSYDANEKGYVSIMSIWGDTYDEIPLRQTVSIGFHSVFTPLEGGQKPPSE